MNSSHKLAAVIRLMFALFLVVVAFALLFKATPRPATAQAPQSPASQNERQLENLIPKHVPLDVKLTKEKEKAFKDLKNENWARDFELEITNTGEKPIYTFY